MNKVTMLGTFKGRVVEHAYGETKGNEEEGKDPLPQFIVDVALEQRYDEKDEQWQDYTEMDEHIVVYLHLFNHDGAESFHHAQVMKVFGWDGTSFAELDGLNLEGLVFQVRVEENEFGGNITNKVNWIDVEDAVPGQRIRRLDAADLKAADKRHAILLKKSSGAVVKPKGRNKVVAPAAPKTQAPSTADKATKNRLRREQELADKEAKDDATDATDASDNGDGTTTNPPKSSMPKFSKKAKPAPAPTMTAEEAWGKVVEAGAKAGFSDEDVQNTLEEELVEVTGKEEVSLDDITGEAWPAIVESTIARFGG